MKKISLTFIALFILLIPQVIHASFYTDIAREAGIVLADRLQGGQSVLLGATYTRISQGGTSTTVAPTLGVVMTGNSSGGWDYTATSTLNITAVDLDCTDCLNETQIEDIYLLNNADDITTGQLTAANFVGSDATATSTFAAGFTVQTSALVVQDDSGFVGIGIATPSQKLTVLGAGVLSTLINSSDNQAQLILDGTRTGNAGVGVLRFDNAGDSIASVVGHRSGANDAGKLTFSTQKTGESNTERMVIDTAGNVGIGTTTPGSLLSVGDTAGINFSTGTSTFSSAGGIDLQGGCFAVNGTCVGGGGHDLVTLAGEDFLTLSGQEITAVAINPDNLASADFGEFTCNGTTCVLEATNTTLTTLANVVEVGALNAGSITSGFTSIDLGAGTFDTTGAVGAGSLTVTGETSLTAATSTTFGITSLATAAGAFLAVDTAGDVIATTTPSGADQTPWTSNIDAATYDLTNTGQIGVASSTPWGHLSVTGAGTLPSFVVEDEANNTDFIVTGAGLVGIGTLAPAGMLDVALAVDSPSIYFDGYEAGSTQPLLYFRKSNSDTLGTLTETEASDFFGQINFQGVDSGSAFDFGAIIRAKQDGSAGDTLPTNLIFETYSDTAINSNQLVLHNDGNIGIGTTTPSNLFSVHGSGYISSDLFVGGAVTATSTVDFGGATSLEIPNGASPTVDAQGETAYDETAGQLLVYGNGKTNVFTSTSTIEKTVNVPTDLTGLDYPLTKFIQAGTIKKIFCITDPTDVTGQDQDIEIYEASSTGGSTTTVDAIITCDADGAEDDGTLANPSIDANDWLGIHFGTASGTPPMLTFVIKYTEDRK